MRVHRSFGTLSEQRFSRHILRLGGIRYDACEKAPMGDFGA
jgi:hypothetical protein